MLPKAVIWITLLFFCWPSQIWITALPSNLNQLMQFGFFLQPSIEWPIWSPTWFHKHIFLVNGCKKSLTTNKETPPNNDKFCMIAFNTRSKCPKVSLSLIFHILSSAYKKVLNTWLFLFVGFHSWLNREIKWRMQCNAIANCSSWLIKSLVLLSQKSF